MRRVMWLHLPGKPAGLFWILRGHMGDRASLYETHPKKPVKLVRDADTGGGGLPCAGLRRQTRARRLAARQKESRPGEEKQAGGN